MILDDGNFVATRRYIIRCRQTVTWLSVVLGLLWATAGCTTAGTQGAAGTRPQSAKIAPELIALYDEYTSHPASGRKEPFRSANPLLHTVDNRVVVDAVASGDASVLEGDLVALGMRDAVRFGRIVSGQLPISSIPALATLPSLNLVRAASGLTQKMQSRGSRSSEL
jgi:hypothetical protein